MDPRPNRKGKGDFKYQLHLEKLNSSKESNCAAMGSLLRFPDIEVRQQANAAPLLDCSSGNQCRMAEGSQHDDVQKKHGSHCISSGHGVYSRDIKSLEMRQGGILASGSSVSADAFSRP
jgi:hypothetical protein